MAVRFDNSGEFLSRAATGLGSTSVTQCAWVYIDTDRDTYSYFMGADDASANFHLLGFDVTGTAINASTTDGFALGDSLSVGTWYFTAMVYDSAGSPDTLYWAAYGAGSLSSAASSPNQLSGITDSWTFRIGTDGFADEWLNGRVAHARVWTATLTGTELLAEMNSETAVRTANAWGFYPLASDYNDASGNARHLSSTGTLSFVAGPVLGATPPSTPEAPIIDSAWNQSVHALLLNAPSDNGSAISSYGWQIAPQVTGSPGTPVTVSGQTTRELNAPGLTNDTSYYARVKATNAGGDSSYSSWSDVKTVIDSGDAVRVSNTGDIKVSAFSSLYLRMQEFVAKFPTSISANNRNFVDQFGDPIFMYGDTAWSIVGSLTNSEIDQYLDDRKNRGFTYLIASIPEPYYVVTPPRNVDGDLPFTGVAYQSTLNTAYFNRAVYFVEGCEARGITVNLCPFYLGYVDSPGGSDASSLDGWGAQVVAASNAQMRTYAGYMHGLFGSFPNINWLIGHDRIPGTTIRDRASAFIDELRNVLGNTQMITYGGLHYQDINGTDTFGFGSADWSTVATTHTPDYDTQYDYSEYAAVNAYTMATNSPTYPFIGFEFKYEQEQSVTNTVLVRQLYAPACAGATGMVIGINPIWCFENNALFAYTGTWESNMDSTLSNYAEIFINFWKLLGTEWANTSADTTSTFVTSQGAGADRIAARFGPNMGIIFHPNMTGSMALDLTEFSANWTTVAIRRFDPINGTMINIDAAASTSNSAYSVGAQGNNAAGSGHAYWAFIITGATHA